MQLLSSMAQNVWFKKNML